MANYRISDLTEKLVLDSDGAGAGADDNALMLLARSGSHNEKIKYINFKKTLTDHCVYVTGDQTVSGKKTFADEITFLDRVNIHTIVDTTQAGDISGNVFVGESGLFETVGIGTPFLNRDGHPKYSLHVSGNTFFGGDVTVTGTMMTLNMTDLNVTGNVSISGTLTMADGEEIITDKVRARDSDGLYLVDDSNNGIFVQDGGNIGIGTSTPSSTLDVHGNVTIPATSANDFYITGNPAATLQVENVTRMGADVWGHFKGLHHSYNRFQFVWGDADEGTGAYDDWEDYSSLFFDQTHILQGARGDASHSGIALAHHTLQGLNENQTYYARVIAKNLVASESVWSDVTTFKTPAVDTDSSILPKVDASKVQEATPFAFEGYTGHIRLWTHRAKLNVNDAVAAREFYSFNTLGCPRASDDLPQHIGPSVRIGIGGITTPQAKLHVLASNNLASLPADHKDAMTITAFQDDAAAAIFENGKVGIYGTRETGEHMVPLQPAHTLHVVGDTYISGGRDGFGRGDVYISGGSVLAEKGLKLVTPLEDVAGHLSVEFGKGDRANPDHRDFSAFVLENDQPWTGNPPEVKFFWGRWDGGDFLWENSVNMALSRIRKPASDPDWTGHHWLAYLNRSAANIASPTQDFYCNAQVNEEWIWESAKNLGAPAYYTPEVRSFEGIKHGSIWTKHRPGDSSWGPSGATLFVGVEDKWTTPANSYLASFNDKSESIFNIRANPSRVEVMGETYLEGNVGIGTATPSGLLHINNDDDSMENLLLVEDSAHPDSTPFVVTSGGSVGIGTINPRNDLALDTRGTIRFYNDATAHYPEIVGTTNEVGLNFANSQSNWTLFLDDSTLDEMPAGGLGFHGGNTPTLKMVLDDDGKLTIGSANPLGTFNVTGSAYLEDAYATGSDGEWGRLLPSTTSTPPSAGGPGTPGQTAYDDNYFYVCVATDTWKRTALGTW